jgi:hypothetical protein
MFELQPIYDRTANAPGLPGKHDDEPTTWHVKGNLFLTGYEWSSRGDGREHSIGYAYYFDFNDGNRTTSQPDGHIPPLCARCACAVPAIRLGDRER